jgi:hypothetical protein
LVIASGYRKDRQGTTSIAFTAEPQSAPSFAEFLIFSLRVLGILGDSAVNAINRSAEILPLPETNYR